MDLVLLPALVAIAILPALVQEPSDFYIYYEAARRWKDVYTPNALGFYYLPWALMIVFPLTLFPVRVAWALFNSVSVGAVWIILKQLSKDPLGPAIAIARVPFALQLSLGQWDACSVTATLVGAWALETNRPLIFGLASVLMATKPNTLIPAGLYFVLWMWRRPVGFWVRALSPAAVVVWLSLALLGWWVPGYLSYVRLDPPGMIQTLSVTWGSFPASLHLSYSMRVGFVVAWLLVLFRLRDYPPHVFTSFLLVFGVVLWPYANLYNYVNAAPAIAWLYATHRSVGLLAVIGELVAIVALLAGGPAWLLPLVWLLVAVVVSGLEREPTAVSASAPAH